jgi:hypothetical protein
MWRHFCAKQLLNELSRPPGAAGDPPVNRESTAGIYRLF